MGVFHHFLLKACFVKFFIKFWVFCSVTVSSCLLFSIHMPFFISSLASVSATLFKISKSKNRAVIIGHEAYIGIYQIYREGSHWDIQSAQFFYKNLLKDIFVFMPNVWTRCRFFPTCVCSWGGPWCSSGAGESQWEAPRGVVYTLLAGRLEETSWWHPACQRLKAGGRHIVRK